MNIQDAFEAWWISSDGLPGPPVDRKDLALMAYTARNELAIASARLEEARWWDATWGARRKAKTRANRIAKLEEIVAGRQQADGALLTEEELEHCLWTEEGEEFDLQAATARINAMLKEKA